MVGISTLHTINVIQRSYADLIAKGVVIGDISSRKSPRQSARD